MATNQFQKGDIGFVMHHDSWLSRAIAWFMSSKWSHCTLVLDTTSSERTYVSETSDYEVTVSWMEGRYIGNVSMAVLRLPGLSAAEASEAQDRALSQQEDLYPYFQLISLGVRGLLKKIKIHIGNFLPWGYDCSEHVLYAMMNTHYPELKGVNPHSMDTQDLFALLMGIPGIQVIYSQAEGS